MADVFYMICIKRESHHKTGEELPRLPPPEDTTPERKHRVKIQGFVPCLARIGQLRTRSPFGQLSRKGWAVRVAGP